ncbi:hypothetical protein [Paenibacillus illinoisensis]|uniref:hypothetical protein n=1 Tax=Paenibacillus illinoisensis TaxID=59845 RepID=UPI00203F8359|nr:hypothetical protein [Paenibacillus illinoisensis]MCM3205676.1 hypothetical protein [Paenibacillus illinoisensis]
MIKAFGYRLIRNLYVQHVLVGLVFATVLCEWLSFPDDAFWIIVIIWPLIVALWFYAFFNGTLPGMNL